MAVTSISKEVAAAFDAIRKTKGIRATLTSHGTQIEVGDVNAVREAVKAAHRAAKTVKQVKKSNINRNPLGRTNQVLSLNPILYRFHPWGSYYVPYCI